MGYMVTGSVASTLYGRPRFTHDVDIVIELELGAAEELVKLFPLDEFYCPPVEIIKIEMCRDSGGHFNLIHHKTGFKADIYPICKDPLHKWAIKHRNKTIVDGNCVWLAPPEYVIIRKLQFFREGSSQKHLSDISEMLNSKAESIDFELLKEKLGEFGLKDIWEKNF